MPDAQTLDGAGTKWVGELSKPDHRMHALYTEVRDRVTGACSYCATAFQVDKSVRANEVTLLSEFDAHPSILRLINDGYQVVTY